MRRRSCWLLSFRSHCFSIGWSLLTIISHCVMSSPPVVVPPPDIRIVFSDLDGTLIHYPSNTTTAAASDGVIALPASATGLTGTLTRDTMALCRVIRRGRSASSRNDDVVPAPQQRDARRRGGSGCKLAFISGMRFSTLLTRIPYLPRADAYACDSGGRIFIAHDDDDSIDDDDIDQDDDDSSAEKSSHDNNNDDDQINNNSSNQARTTRRRARKTLLKIVPVDPLDKPFYLTEDMAWRKRIAAVVGSDGYVGHELLSYYVVRNKNNKEEEERTIPTTTSPPLPLAERRGPLWNCANALLQHRSPTMNTIRIDTTGYATCFRINRQHNNISVFDDLLASVLHNNDNDDNNNNRNSSNNNTGLLDGILDPALLTTSVNLGCIDVVPVVSGKKNWSVYIPISLDHVCSEQSSRRIV
jgi:hypothetical protein